MFAVIKHNNNQYKVEEDKEYNISDASAKEESGKIVFDKVLLVDDGKDVIVGEPEINGAKVEAEIVGSVRGKKVEIFKFKSKKRYKRTAGHRQDYLRVKILSIKK